MPNITLSIPTDLKMDSEISPEDAVKMGQQVNRLLAKRYKVEKERE